MHWENFGVRCTGEAGISVFWESIHLMHLVLQPVTILVALLDAFQFVGVSPVPGEPNVVPLGSILFQMIPLAAHEPTLASI